MAGPDDPNEPDEADAPEAVTSNISTRELCSAALYHPPFARLLFETLCIRNVRTMAPSPGIDLVALARHAAWAIGRRCRRAMAVTAVFAVVLLTSPLLLVVPLVWVGAVVVVLVAALVWSLVDEIRIQEHAIRLVDTFDEDDRLGEGTVGADDEARLAAVNGANLSIYAPALADNPFPGLGQLVESWGIGLVEVAKPKDPDRPVEDFTAAELLDHLAVQVPKHVEVDAVNNLVDAALVVYVRGDAVQRLPWLLPDPKGAPVTRLPTARIHEIADHPLPYARTYLRAQVVSHEGRVVTTVHAKAARARMGLSLDFTLHVLRPIHPAFRDADYLPRRRRRLGTHLLVHGSVVHDFALAPLEAWRSMVLLGSAGRDAELSRAQQKAVGLRDFHGTYDGLRDVASVGTSLDRNKRGDVVQQSTELVAAVTHELLLFLEARNIDTAELRKQRVTIEQHIGTKVGKVINRIYHGGVKIDGSTIIGGNIKADLGTIPNIEQDISDIRAGGEDANGDDGTT
jgi:hypothetical protein